MSSMEQLLIDDTTLERSEIVANNAMNRERGIAGPNSYARDLGFDPVAYLLDRLAHQERVAWLDICCGTGRALIQAAHAFNQPATEGRIEIIGIDLVTMFDPITGGLSGLQLLEASVSHWKPTGSFDLITCVHGLHYVGDKLGVLCRAAGWLKSDGRLLAHLDLQNLRLRGDESRRHPWRAALKHAGFPYLPHRHLIDLKRQLETDIPYRYLGADDQAGPNYSGQPAVDSWYEYNERKTDTGK
jgi:SAM-dependent methyltransferase